MSDLEPFKCLSCIKTAYWTEEDAEAARLRYGRRGTNGGGWRIYRGRCGHWHIATSKREKRRRLERRRSQ